MTKYLQLLIICFLSFSLSGQESDPILCGDGIDNDNDGLIDCEDPDCDYSVNQGCETCMYDGSSFADFIIDYSDGCSGTNQYTDTEMSLGVPNYNGIPTDNTYLSLGHGGYVKLGFSNNILSNSGDTDFDLFIFEIGPAVEPCDIEIKPFDTFTLNALLNLGLDDDDDDGYYSFGQIGGATSGVDIDAMMPGFSNGALKFDAVKVIDVLDDNCGSSSPGADIDAICALNNIVTPPCDSLIIQNESVSICEGDSIEINGQYFTTEGFYEQLFLTADGCDSILSIQVFTFPSSSEELEINICPGDTVVLNGEIYNSSGVYQQTLASTNGCDSILSIQVSMLLLSIEDIEIAKCPEDSYVLNGETYIASGSYQQTLASTNGCDSILDLTITNYDSNDLNFEYNFCAGFELNLDGFIYDEFGSFQDVLIDVNGCEYLQNVNIIEKADCDNCGTTTTTTHSMNIKKLDHNLFELTLTLDDKSVIHDVVDMNQMHYIITAFILAQNAIDQKNKNVLGIYENAKRINANKNITRLEYPSKKMVNKLLHSIESNDKYSISDIKSQYNFYTRDIKKMNISNSITIGG